MAESSSAIRMRTAIGRGRDEPTRFGPLVASLEMVKNCVEIRSEHPHYAPEQYLSRNTVDTGLPGWLLES